MSELVEIKDGRFFKWLDSRWGICPDRVRPDLKIEGSPERSFSRIVFQDNKNRLFLLEKIAPDHCAHRTKIAENIARLNRNGLLQALSYCRTENGGYLARLSHRKNNRKSAQDDEQRDTPYGFQISPFLPSEGIQRPGYLSSAGTGKEFGNFIISLTRISCSLHMERFGQTFSILSYINRLFEQMKVHDRKVVPKFSTVLDFLKKDFFKNHDQLPLAFCHGDLHPLNVIWQKGKITAVIDWEFAGVKPEIYDAANLLGCAGIENPEGLGMPMVMTMLEHIKKANIFSPISWEYLPEYIVALRFAWLSEWLRKKDIEMIEMEECFMKIFMENITTLRNGWGIRR